MAIPSPLRDKRNTQTVQSCRTAWTAACSARGILLPPGRATTSARTSARAQNHKISGSTEGAGPCRAAAAADGRLLDAAQHASRTAVPYVQHGPRAACARMAAADGRMQRGGAPTKRGPPRTWQRTGHAGSAPVRRAAHRSRGQRTGHAGPRAAGVRRPARGEATAAPSPSAAHHPRAHARGTTMARPQGARQGGTVLQACRHAGRHEQEEQRRRGKPARGSEARAAPEAWAAIAPTCQ
jgi:hypothetical protein